MVNQLGHVSSPEFWPAATNSAAAIVVLVVSATKWTAEATGVELRTTRSSWRSPLGSGWPECGRKHVGDEVRDGAGV